MAQRVRQGGHNIPPATIRRRFARGWENLQSDYLGIVDAWSIYDASKAPASLIETGYNQPPQRLMEDSEPYRSARPQPDSVQPLDDPDFSGAEAAFKRAAANAIEPAQTGWNR